MTNHHAYIHVEIPFNSNPGDDPSQLADHITRQLIETLQQHLPRPLSFTAHLDDVTDSTPPRLTYRVSCLSTLLYRTEFEIQADSPEQAIEFAINRNDDAGHYIEPCAEKFLETESEGDWHAEPIG